MSDFKDVSPAGDKSVLLKVKERGAEGPSPGDLSVCHAHYRLLKETKSGEKVKDGSMQVREYVPVKWKKVPSVLRDLEVPQYKFRTVEDKNVKPRVFVVGEGEVPECVDFAVRRLGAGGSLVLKLADVGLPEGRPKGPLTVEVELVRWEEPCRGPGDAGWAGLRSIEAERMKAQDFLRVADSARGHVEALHSLRAEWNVDDVLNGQALAVKKGSQRAKRRFRRAARWLDSCGKDARADQERARILVGLAKAEILEHKELLADPTADPKAVKSLPLLAARAMAAQACELAPEDPDARTVAGLAQAELGDLAKAREHLTAALALDPQHTAAKSELARVNTRERNLAMKDGDRQFLGSKEKLDAVLRQGASAEVKDLVAQLAQLVEGGTVSWDACMQSKLGKTLGDMRKKPPNKEMQALAESTLGTLYAFTDKKCRQFI